MSEETIKTVLVEASRLDKKRQVDITKGKRAGEKSTVFDMSLRIKGAWYRGSVWSEEASQKVLKAGENNETMTILMYKSEYKGRHYWNWKLPSKEKQQEAVLDELHLKIRDLERRMQIVETHIKLS